MASESKASGEAKGAATRSALPVFKQLARTHGTEHGSSKWLSVKEAMRESEAMQDVWKKTKMLVLAQEHSKPSVRFKLRFLFLDLTERDCYIIGSLMHDHPTLLELTLEGNQLGPEGGKHIANALKANTTLQILGLNLNALGPEGAQHIAEALMENTTLKLLQLGSNFLGPKGFKHLAQALKVNSTLTLLGLDNNFAGPAATKHIAEALEENTTLLYVWLKDCFLEPGHRARIEKALIRNIKLRRRSRQGHRATKGTKLRSATAATHSKAPASVEAHGGTTLARATDAKDDATGPQAVVAVRNTRAAAASDVQATSHIQLIAAPAELRDDGVTALPASDGAVEATDVVVAVRTGEDTRDDDFGAQWLSVEEAKREIAAMQDGATKTNMLRIALAKEPRVSFINTNLTEREAFIIGSLMLEHWTLFRLKLSGNNLGPAGSRHIANAIKVNVTLQEFEIENNWLGPEGGAHIAEALKLNTSLHMVELFHTFLMSEGGGHIAEALKVNATMQELELANNVFGPEGCKRIADAIKVNTTLTSLGLDRNKLGPTGGKYIAEALKVNTTLRKVRLSGNNLGTDGARHIAEALKMNTTLQELEYV